MNRKTKDLILIYICFALFAVALIIWCITLKSCNDQIFQPQEVIQEQQAEVPIVYDRPMENHIARIEAVQQPPEPENEFRQILEVCDSQCIGIYYVNR